MLPQFGTHTITAIIINKIEMIQHRAACFVLDCPWRRDLRDSITSMLPSLGWPSLQLRRKCAIDLLYCLSFFITSWWFHLNISQYHRQWPQQEQIMISSFCINRPLLTATSSLFSKNSSRVKCSPIIYSKWTNIRFFHEIIVSAL